MQENKTSPQPCLVAGIKRVSVLCSAKQLRPLPAIRSPKLGEGVQSLEKERIINSCVSTVKNLTSYRPNVLTTSAKPAFTLAEVLITLGIIGVVAALTFSSVIVNVQNQVLKEQFKKAYSELSQINQKFVQEKGMNMCQYDWELLNNGYTLNQATREIANTMAKYFSGYGEAKLLGEGYNELKNLQNIAMDSNYFNDGFVSDLHKRTFYFEYGDVNRKCPIITVDINGYHHKPNRFGYDLFSFRPTLNGKMLPIGDPALINDGINGTALLWGDRNVDCSKTSTSNNNGIGCAYWASIDVNPDDNDKSYWKEFLK